MVLELAAVPKQVVQFDGIDVGSFLRLSSVFEGTTSEFFSHRRRTRPSEEWFRPYTIDRSLMRPMMNSELLDPPG